MRIDTPVDLDGRLSEAVWEQALDASAYLQDHPLRDDPSQVRTMVKILYDNEHLYLGFDCVDSQMDKIIADIKTRDGELRANDSVHVLLSPIHDTVHLYYFSVNPLGTQMDGKFSLEDRGLDLSWQGEWEAAAVKTEYGWSAEIVIDLKSLGYEATSRKTLSIGLSRIVPRLDSAFWSGPLEPAFDLSSPGAIQELQLLEVAKKLRLRPYAMYGKTSTEAGEFSAGLDLNYDVNPRITANINVYPEFDTVRADQELVNLTEFELRLDELRGYFLDGFDDYYRQPLEMFYSKRVQDIYGGVKFYGEAGTLRFSGASVQERKLQSQNDKSANWTTLRLKNEFGKSMQLGVTVANRLLDGSYVGSAGAEGALKLGNFRIYGLYSYSYGEFDSDNSAFLFKSSFITPTFHTELSYSQIEERFWENANVVGYIVDDNRKEWDLRLGKTFFFELGEIQGVDYDSAYNMYHGFDGSLRSWQINQELALLFGEHWRVGVNFRGDYKLNEFYPDWLPDDNLIHTADWLAFRDATLASLSRWNPEYVFDLVNPTISESTSGYSLYLGKREYHNSLIKVFSGFDRGDKNAFWFGYGFGRHYVRPINTFELYKEITISQSLYLQYEFSLVQVKGDIEPISEPVYRSNSINVIKLNLMASPTIHFGGFFQTSSLRKKHSLQLEAKFFFLPPTSYAQLVYKHGLSPFNGGQNSDNAVYLKVFYEF